MYVRFPSHVRFHWLGRSHHMCVGGFLAHVRVRWFARFPSYVCFRGFPRFPPYVRFRPERVSVQRAVLLNVMFFRHTRTSASIGSVFFSFQCARLSSQLVFLSPPHARSTIFVLFAFGFAVLVVVGGRVVVNVVIARFSRDHALVKCEMRNAC